MSLKKAFDRMFGRVFVQFPLIPKNATYNPRMVQRPLIDAGNTGRYALDGFQVAFNSPAGNGTLCPNAPGHGGVYLDVSSQKAAVYGGMGSIPSTPELQGLVRGFRDT